MELEVLKAEPLCKYPIPLVVQNAYVGSLWTTSEATDEGDFARSYFDHYARRVQRSLLNGRAFCLSKHSEVIAIGRKILSGTSRAEIHEQLSNYPGAVASDDEIDEAIDLCASLLVMTEIELKANLESISGRTPIPWESKSLHAAVANYFVSQTTLRVDSPKLGRLFTARNLDRISGIRIRWTTNLADHLRLVDDDRAVFVFHCASFLNFQLGQEGSPLPKPLIQETLSTLALLFPSADKGTGSWLQGQKKTHTIDRQLERCGSLRTRERRIENFSVWHDRLVILKQAFDDSQPASLSQWWLDRRNRVQWYTFWVAVLVFVMTMFSGIVQSLEGAVQVYLAYKSQEQRNN